MTNNKLTDLDNNLKEFAQKNDLKYIVNNESNKIVNVESFMEVNIDSIISKIVKGDNIKAISKDSIKKNISGYLIDCIVQGKNEFDIVICIPIKTHKKFMTLSSNDYNFYFKHRISKNKSKRELFISMLKNN